MKKSLKLLLGLAVASTMMLAGCNQNNPDPESHATGLDPDPSTETSGGESTGEETSGEETTGEETSGEESTGEESTAESTGEESTGEESTGESTEAQPRPFPADDVVAFFAEAELTVVVPTYAAAANVDFEVEADPLPGYFDIYANYSTGEELVAYKNLLKTQGWAVISDGEETAEDFRLKYGDLEAYVDLLNYGDEDYMMVSFFYKTAEANTAEKVTEAFNANIAAKGYTFKATWDEDREVYSLSVNFGASDDESEESLSTAAATLASFLPNVMVPFSSVYGDPTAEDYKDIFGDGSIYYRILEVSVDYAVVADIISYVYNGYLGAQIAIYDL